MTHKMVVVLSMYVPRKAAASTATSIAPRTVPMKMVDDTIMLGPAPWRMRIQISSLVASDLPNLNINISTVALRS